MTAVERLLRRLAVTGGVFLRRGRVHVTSAAWGALTTAERRALVERRDDIRELLTADPVTADSTLDTAPDGLRSRKSDAANANGDKVIRPAGSRRVSNVSPRGADSASRDGGDTEGGAAGYGVGVEVVEGVRAEGSAAAGAPVTARGDSEGAESARVVAGRQNEREGPPRGNVGENGGMNLVPPSSEARAPANRPSKNQERISTPGYTSRAQSQSKYDSRYIRHGAAIIDTESFEWARRRYFRSTDKLLDRVRRDARRDFARLNEVPTWRRGGHA